MEKEATTTDLFCHVFVVADGIVNIVENKLQGMEYEIIETPFHMIIVGMTACGKTHYLLKMLEEDYMNHFDYIFIVRPTFVDNKTYQKWKYIMDPDILPIACEHDEVDDKLRDIVKFVKNSNSLIILDECAASQSVKNRTSELIKLAFHCRHIGLSTIVITQQLTSIAKPYRLNISKLVTFYNACKDDTKFIFNNYLNVDKDQERGIIVVMINNI